MYRPLHPSLGRVKTNMDGQKYGSMGGGRVKKEGAKKSSKTIDIVSCALKVSVNGVICVFVAHFRSSGTSESWQTNLIVNIHVSTKTCVTGNHFMLHKALYVSVEIIKNIYDEC